MIKRVLLMALLFLMGCSEVSYALEIIRQKNTATKIVFPMIDADGDTVTGATGLDSEESHWDNSTNPSSFADLTNEATEIGTTGIYYLSLTSGEMNQDYVAIQVKTTSSGGKTQHILLRTVVGDPRNMATVTTGGNSIDVTSTGEVGLDLSNVNGTLDASEIGTDAITSAKIGADAIGSSEIAADAIGASEIAASAITSSEFAQSAADLVWSSTTRSLTDKDGFRLSATGVDDIWDESQGGHVTAGTFGKYLDESISGLDDNPWDNATRTITGGTIDTNNDKSGYRLSATGVDDIWDESQSGHTTTGTFGKYLDEAISGIDDNPWDNGTRTLTSNANFNDPTAATIADAVWDELRADHTISGSFGQGVASVQGNVTGSVNSVTSAVTVGTNNDKTGYRLSATGVDDIWDEVQSGHVTAGTFGKYLDIQVSSISGGSCPTVGQIADQVWDEAIADHLTSGTTGNKLNAAGNAGDPWNTSLPGSYASGTAGKILSNINDSTDGDKEGSSYTGIENTIRQNR